MEDKEKQEKDEKSKLRYPRCIFFIVVNEFCERFNFYGMRAILVLYLQQKLNFDEDTSTVLFHSFIFIGYFVPLFGAILADSGLGKFRTILYLSIVYAIGSATIAVGSVPVLNLPERLMTLIGLLLIALGMGGIKPCVAAFGGDQFKMPEQARSLATFFSLFYFAINAGSLMSMSLTPILRQDVHCFGDNDCFPLAFGVPGVLMVLAVIIFACGKPFYTIKKPTGNMIVMVSRCIGNAISSRGSDTVKRDHWLDYAEPKHGPVLVKEVKVLLSIIVLYLPLPVFWALFDQQGSRWTFQATRMDGDLGFYKIKPDQMQVINPLLILVFIPLFDYWVYPLIAFCGIKRPLQKLTLGGILASCAFVISGLVEWRLQQREDNSQPKLCMLWLVPQYVTMTAAEVMFSVTGLEFSFTQAPVSMKSVLQAAWLMTIAVGNMIVAIIAELSFFKSQALEFFLFAGLMLFDMGIFSLLALRYTYFDYTQVEEEVKVNYTGMYWVYYKIKRGARRLWRGRS